jgi:hypothetical protein
MSGVFTVTGGQSTSYLLLKPIAPLLSMDEINVGGIVGYHRAWCCL